MEAEAEEAVPQPGPQGRHLKKRGLKNKALAIDFNEKDLRDYVTGFHKRKKKRRKEAHRQQEEAQRRKRSEDRKKRKFEKELALYGGVLPTRDSEPDEIDKDQEDMEDPIDGTKTYENDDVHVTVITSEISREDESYAGKTTAAAAFQFDRADKRPKSVPINNKKPFKKVAKHRSQPKPRSKRDKRKGKKRGKKDRS